MVRKRVETGPSKRARITQLSNGLFLEWKRLGQKLPVQIARVRNCGQFWYSVQTPVNTNSSFKKSDRAHANSAPLVQQDPFPCDVVLWTASRVHASCEHPTYNVNIFYGLSIHSASLRAVCWQVLKIVQSTLFRFVFLRVTRNQTNLPYSTFQIAHSYVPEKQLSQFPM